LRFPLRVSLFCNFCFLSAATLAETKRNIHLLPPKVNSGRRGFGSPPLRASDPVTGSIAEILAKGK
jgi:hypothetical protein